MTADRVATMEWTARDWPVPWANAIPDWLGEVAVEIPAAIAQRPAELLGILASHQFRDDPLEAGWEQALESALGHAKRTQLVLLFAAQSPYAERLRHACQRFGVAFLTLTCQGDGVQIEPSANTMVLRHVGNPLADNPRVAGCRLEDRAIAILSHQLFALRIRKGGKIETLIEARLDEPKITPGSTLVACQSRSPRGASRSPELRLSQRGAVLWMRHASSDDPSRGDLRIASTWGCRARRHPSTWVPVGKASESLMRSSSFLIHCTRGRRGAWPNQSQADLFDEAIRMAWRQDVSALETLHRIVVTQRLVAQSSLRRGDVATVCFTALSLAETLAMRSFQSHLGRWDWEPYGLAVRRDWLQRYGARPVRYLDPKAIANLPNEEQSFAQPLPRSDRNRDWSVEQEWRIRDDVRLSRIPFDQAVLFVRYRTDAALLSPFSRWPIVYIDDLDRPRIT